MRVAFLDVLDLGAFSGSVEADFIVAHVETRSCIVEDYPPLDIESATRALALCGVFGAYLH